MAVTVRSSVIVIVVKNVVHTVLVVFAGVSSTGFEKAELLEESQLGV